jgi:serine/threonine-protein kinase
VGIAPGETFDRYAVEALIGRGGMGEVYRATDTRLRRKVAIKVLRAAPDGRDASDAVARLFREARAAAAFSHPNTIAIHDLGEADGTFYIVMELVTGKPMLAFVGDDRAPLARKVGWLVDVARALAAAHKAGVLHRDVKPSNVMIGDDDDVVKVLDFGLAKPLDPVSFNTAVGRVVGTPRYMAPELLSGGEADARSDQYSFGVTAYELISGVHPLGRLGMEAPKPLAAIAPDVPSALASVVARTMASRAADRFESMEDVARALADVRGGRPVRVAVAPVTVTVGRGEAALATTLPATVPAPTAAATQAATHAATQAPSGSSGPVTAAEPTLSMPGADRETLEPEPVAARGARAAAAPPAPLDKRETLKSASAPPAPMAAVGAVGAVGAAEPIAPVAAVGAAEPIAPVAAVGAAEPIAPPAPPPGPAAAAAPAPVSPARWLLVAAAIAVLGAAAFAGTYFATRATASPPPAPTASPSASAPPGHAGLGAPIH